MDASIPEADSVLLGLVAQLRESYAEHGPEAIERLALERPGDFISLVTKFAIPEKDKADEDERILRRDMRRHSEMMDEVIQEFDEKRHEWLETLERCSHCGTLLMPV
jgi:hypothetical protein